MIILTPINSDQKSQVAKEDLARICKYMVNFMVGRVIFNDDGDFVDSSEKFPTVCTPDGTLFIKAAEGTIIFHSDVNIDNSFIQRMSAALSELLNKYTKIRAYMQQYHTIFNGLYTNVKAKTNATDVISA